MSPDAIARRRAELGRQALAELASFRLFEIAEKAVSENIDFLRDAPQMQQQLTKALNELREGVAATKRMVLERCEMRQDGDGQFRSIREPLPRRALGAAKSWA
jgi:hypothetical protein